MLVLGSASVKESLFKKLIEWAKNKNNGMEKLICATQSNWINWHEDLALAKVKATISLIDLFLQLEENVKNEWIFQYICSSPGQLWNILELEVWPYFWLQVLAIWNLS